MPGAISSADQLAGLVATEPTLEGEQVTTRRFSPRTHVGVRAQLSGTLRAFSLEGDQNQLLAGVVKDGDRVDFVAALKKPGDQDIYFSRVLVRDIKVLSAPNVAAARQQADRRSELDYAVMLALTDSQAQKLQYMLANAGGTGAERWHLELRPSTHAADSPDHLDSFESVLAGGLSAGQRKTLRPLGGHDEQRQRIRNQEPEPDLRHGRLRRAAGSAGRARSAPRGRARRLGRRRSRRPPPPSPAGT